MTEERIFRLESEAVDTAYLAEVWL